MHYILYPDAQTLLPQVIETQGLLDLLARQELSPDARLFVPETDSYIPAIETAVLLSRERGIPLSPLPELVPDRFVLVANSGAGGRDNGRPDSLDWDAETDDISQLPLIGAPLAHLAPPKPAREETSGRVVAPVGLASSTAAAKRDPHELLYDHVRSLASVSLDTFYGSADGQMLACLASYRRTLARQIQGWLLMPLLFTGIFQLVRARKERRNIDIRLAQIGVTEMTWDQTLRDDRETRRLKRLIPKVMAASIIFLSFLCLMLVLETDVVARVVYFFQTDSFKASKKSNMIHHNNSRPGWLKIGD